MKRNKMLAEERRQQLLQHIKENGVVTTSDLAGDYHVSQMTIRNDLRLLAMQGHLERIHGGAIAQRWLSKEPSYNEKALLHPQQKRGIGREAARIIEEGMAVFIGNGSTTMEIIRHLPRDRQFRIFTNSLNHAVEMTAYENAEVFVIGGFLRGSSLAMVGRLAHQALQGIYFDIAFLGVNGLSLEYGLTIPSLEETETASEVIRHSQRTIIVADHTKFGIVTHGKIADISDVDILITDKGPIASFCQTLATLNVELRVVLSEKEVEVISKST